MNNPRQNFIQQYDGGIRLSVRARPGISKARAPQLVDIGDGKCALEITVAAEAQEGKANKAIEEATAALMGVKKKDVSIKTGQTGRLKIVEVAGDPSTLHDRALALLQINRQ